MKGKKGEISIGEIPGALVGWGVLILIGVIFFLIFKDWILTNLLPVLIGIVIVVAALMIVLTTEDFWDKGIAVGSVFMLLLLGVGLVFSPQIGELNLAIFEPVNSQYEFLSVDAISNYITTGDQAEIQVMWAKKSSVDKSYTGNAYVFVYKNDVFDQSWSKLRWERRIDQRFIVSSLSPGWNKIKVKIALSSLDSRGDCKSSGSKQCTFEDGQSSYGWKYACNGHEAHMDSMTCDLYRELYGTGTFPSVSVTEITKLQTDYSSKLIQSAHLKFYEFEEMVWIGSDIPIEPEPEPEPKTMTFWEKISAWFSELFKNMRWV